MSYFIMMMLFETFSKPHPYIESASSIYRVCLIITKIHLAMSAIYNFSHEL